MNNAEIIQKHIKQVSKKIDQEDRLGSSVEQPLDLKSYLVEGMSQFLDVALHKQRERHLQDQPEDQANGHAPERILRVETSPVSVSIPRTRQGFYLPLLPKYQRTIPQDYQSLLESILLEAKSFKSALRTMQAMGLGYSRSNWTTCSASSMSKPKHLIIERWMSTGSFCTSRTKSCTWSTKKVPWITRCTLWSLA
ncbi:MAG: hypothetical protein GKR87_14435 [Kiritimatiellae bacterium]|nr:hypothetical protein [Kiritimatiellia bacterium]NKB25545.1 hypothetical protein [Kiritimatiellia bacterium]